MEEMKRCCVLFSYALITLSRSMKEMHIRSFAKTISGLNPLSNFRIA